MSERTRLVLLLAVAILVYVNTLLNGFTFDDDFYILNNPAVTNPSVHGLFQPAKENNVFRPVTFASFAINWAIGGSHPLGYHLVNILLHASITVLLYLLLSRLLEFMPRARTIAFVAALLFAVHPIHTEAVASVANRSELLASGFLLAAWLLHINDRQLIAFVCLVLALMSKESAAVFLPLALAGDAARGKLKPLYRYGLVAGLIALYLAAFWKIEGGRFGEKGVSFLDNPLASLPAWLRIANALRIGWKYVGLHLYPAVLSCDYSYNAILLFTNWRHLAPATAGALLVLALWIWAYSTRQREWFLAGAIYFAGFAVTANILLPTGTIMGERLAYLPSAGFCLLAALVWIRLEVHTPKWAWVALGVLLAALAVRTTVRNLDWRDNLTLYASAVRAVPGSAKMHSNLGVQYAASGRLDAAKAQYETALRIYPDYSDAIESLGLLQSKLGQDEDARKSLEAALAMTTISSRDHDFAAVNLAALLIKLGKDEDALKLLNQAIEECPSCSRAWSNRAAIRYHRAEMAGARGDAETALSLDPTNAQAKSLLSALNAPVPVGTRRE